MLLAGWALLRERRMGALLLRRAKWRDASWEPPGQLRFADGTLVQHGVSGLPLAAGPVVVLGRPAAGATYRESATMWTEAVLPGTAESLEQQLAGRLRLADAQAIASVVLLGAPLWAWLLT